MHTLTVADIMSTELVTVDSSMSLLGVASLLSERHLGGAPVLEGRRVVGVISAADVLRHAASATSIGATTGSSPWTPSDEPEEWAEGDDPPAEFYTRLQLDEAMELDPEGDARRALGQTTAADIMTHALCSLPPDAPVVEAATYMMWAEIHRLLVIEHGELVGIVSAMDIVRAVAQRMV